MKIYTIKPLFQKFLNPVKNLLVKLKIHPTSINIAALIISIALGAIIMYAGLFGKLMLLVSVPILAFVRTALNALDGMVARELKVGNQKFGEVLNEFIDRLSDTFIFIGLAFSGLVYLDVALISITIILLTSYIGIVGKAAGGIRQYVGLMGKADRMFYLSLASVLIIIWPSINFLNYLLYFMIILGIITIIQRFLAIKKELHVKKK
jgi:CDP-diacylglycerol--glycerol-3-phosphate 3-phosphatidyltransferase